MFKWQRRIIKTLVPIPNPASLFHKVCKTDEELRFQGAKIYFYYLYLLLKLQRVLPFHLPNIISLLLDAILKPSVSGRTIREYSEN